MEHLGHMILWIPFQWKVRVWKRFDEGCKKEKCYFTTKSDVLGPNFRSIISIFRMITFFAPVLKNNKYTKMNRLIYWKVLKLRHIFDHIFQKVILHSINQCSFSWNGMASFALGKWVGQIVLCQICFFRLFREL